MPKKSFTITFLALCLMVVPFTTQASEGIPLQKDVILGTPIYGPQDLPEEVTFTLYDAQNGLTPLGSQTFPRGQYTVDFEFSQSNGVTGGSVARVKADFTNILNLKDAFGQTLKPTEIWAALEVGGTEVGARTKVSDETLVRLLLNSDASLATYLTLAYQGDDNPITTIYKNLPISLTAADGTKKSLSDYFSGVVVGTAGGKTGEGSTSDPYWERPGSYLYYNDGNVGIGTTSPQSMLHINSGKLVTQSTYGSYGQIQIANPDVGEATLVMAAGVTGGYGGTLTSSDSKYIWAIGPGSYGNTPDKFNIGNNYLGRALLAVDATTGNVGIGTTNPTYELAVNGTIRCKQLIVDTSWADFVFQENYRLPPLNEVERFISQNRHLSGIPTETEVKEKGVSVGDITLKLLQKVEELTLYLIDIKKENDSLKAQVANMEAKLKEIKN